MRSGDASRRKAKGERCPGTVGTFELDGSTVIREDPMGDRESYSGVSWLVRDERLEDGGEDRAVNPRAVVVQSRLPTTIRGRR